MKKVVIGISGGVDSTVAALLLKNKGYEVIGITFIFVDSFNIEDSVEVCKKIGIEHHIVDYRKEFKETVIDGFISDYSKGITPNPCVLCNKYIKFKFLHDMMLEYNCDFIATGHYSKVIDGKLYKSDDLNKDQSYFLSQLTKEQLSKVLFPLEGISKSDVRKIATENDLINSNKKDSFDVCFINNTFKEFISKNISSNKGKVINILTNEVVGKHNGLMNYTIGQRRGLNIGGNDNRLFVVGKNIEKNILYVDSGNTDYLLSDSCIINNVNFNSNIKSEKCMARFRYRSIEYPVTLEYLDNDEILVKYDSIKSVTPGQVCVFYIDNMCIGGGIIKEVRKDNKKLWYLL